MAVASDRATDVLDDVLDGKLGPDAVRQVAEDPLRDGLAEIVRDGFAEGGRSWELELLRTKYKPSRKLTAYYRLTRGGGSDGGGTRHVAVSWFARTPPEDRIAVLVSPADPAMPQLERLTRPGHLVALLEDLTGRQVGTADRVRIGTIRYRPGQRHVLVARLDGGELVYIKTDREHSGAHAVPVAELLADLLSERCPGARVADPVGYAADDSAALWWHAAGKPLSRLLTTRPGEGPRVVERVGRLLRALHDGPSARPRHPALARIGSADVGVEAARTLRAGEHIAALLPPVGQTYGALVREVADRLGRLPAEEATFAHGDFKGDNLLVHDGQLRILDLDRCCWAEAALDLGKFLADLRWWGPLGNAGDVLASAFRAGYGACDPARWARADLYAVLFQLKLAARRCPIHDIRWEAQVRTRVADAAAGLREARSR